MKNTVIFDLDGLLIDSEPVYKRAWQEEAKALGYPIEEAKYELFIGLPTADCEQMLRNWFDNEFPIDEFRLAWQHRRKIILEEEGINFKEGALEILRLLTGNNVRLGLATSSSLEEILENKVLVPELSKFDVILTSDEIKKGKPDPFIYLKACKELSSEPESTIIFEDSNLGMQSAINAGCKSIMIPDLKAPNQFVLENAFRIYDTLIIALEKQSEWL